MVKTLPAIDDPDSGMSTLDDAIAAVYRGTLEDFVRRRDALAKQLRAEKKRDDADRVKALHKPGRAAWALNQVLDESAASIDQLATAIKAAQEAQAQGGAQLRSTLERVRAAVRDVAQAAARAAIRLGHPVEATALVPAVNAVIGDGAAFAALQSGRLSEIPEAGGLDFLTAANPPTTSAVVESSSHQPDRGESVALRAELERAETALTEARARAHAADQAFADAQAHLAAAEQQLQRAKAEADARRADFEHAQHSAQGAALLMQQAQQQAADLKARIAESHGQPKTPRVP